MHTPGTHLSEPCALLSSLPAPHGSWSGLKCIYTSCDEQNLFISDPISQLRHNYTKATCSRNGKTVHRLCNVPEATISLNNYLVRRLKVSAFPFGVENGDPSSSHFPTQPRAPWPSYADFSSSPPPESLHFICYYIIFKVELGKHCEHGGLGTSNKLLTWQNQNLWTSFLDI